MKQLEKILGYSFNDKAMLTLALSHRSVGAQNNERLEFLGDSLVNCVIAADLIQRFPNSDEGQLTRMRAQLVCEDTLAIVAKNLHLGDYVILGAGEQRSGGHQRASILADGLEAIIGAIYLDSGKDFSLVQNLISRWFVDQLSQVKDQAHKDPKTILQELLQAQKLSLPEYNIISVQGEQHDQIFVVSCTVPLFPESSYGEGNSRRKAEQMAAQKILERINNAKQ